MVPPRRPVSGTYGVKQRLMLRTYACGSAGASLFCTLEVYVRMVWCSGGCTQLFTDERGRAAVRRPAHGVDPAAARIQHTRARAVQDSCIVTSGYH